jgi:hypothetical protein
MLAYLETAQMGVHGLLSDASTGSPLYGCVQVVSNAQPVFTDPQLGDYHRMLLPGTYQLTFSAPGYQSRTVTGVVVSQVGLPVRLDVALSPLSSGPAFAAGQWVGRVAILGVDANVRLRAADAQGHFSTSNAFDSVHGSLHHFQISQVPDTRVGVPVSITVSACDSRGYVVDDFTGPVDLAASTAAADRTIGTGGTPTSYPLDTYWHDCRTQVIYTAAELGGACSLKGLALNVQAVPGQTLNRWTIRLKQTALTSYSSQAWESTGWTTVFQRNTTIAAAGWVTFDFDAPFAYDGIGNLMVDFSYNNSNYTQSGSVLSTNSGQTRTLYYSADSNYGDPLTWSGSSPRSHPSSLVPNLRLMVGVQVPSSPASISGFAAGLWQGEVSFLQAADGLAIRVEDRQGREGTSNRFDVTEYVYDLDGDGRIGTGDYALFSPAWNSRPGASNWNAAADFDGDGAIGEADLDCLARNWLKSC